MSRTRLIDARGLKCPLPVLRAERGLAEIAAGDQLRLLATDPVARIDIALFCRNKGHAMAVLEKDGVFEFTITKDAAARA